MGIPYKLDRKIIEFIIFQKKANIKLGCRDFVDIIKNKFGVTISKSTINSVIKEAGLSRRVGRPASGLSKHRSQVIVETKVSKEEKKPSKPPESLKKRQKPIFLPEEKDISSKARGLPKELKSEESKEIFELGPSKPIPKSEFSHQQEPKKPSRPKEEEIAKPLPEAKIAETAKMREIKRMTPVEKISNLMQPIEINEDSIFDCMGAFFLKAAEFEISQESILGKLVRKFAPQLEVVDSEIKSNILLYLPVFGIENLQDINKYEQQGLWVFSNAINKQNYSQLNSFFQELQAKEDLLYAVYTECKNSFKEAHYFKFILFDATVFYMDARLKSIWQEANIPNNFTISFNKANNYIKEKFVQIFTKEIQPILLFNVPSFRSFAPIVSEFIFAFEDVSEKRITEIDIFSAHNQELESYNNIVPAKRMFVFGFWPWQKELKEFLKNEMGVVKDFYFPELARQIYYIETITEFPADSGIRLNLIFIKNSAFSNPRMGLLTNVPIQVMSSQELIKLYLRRWPNFEDTFQDLMASAERLTYRGFVYPAFDEQEKPKKERLYIMPASHKNLDEVLKTLLINLSTASQRHFFPYGYRFADFLTMKQRFYSLPGKLKRKGRNLFITLLPPRDYAFSSDLFYAVRRVNESEIQDVFGYKIWFKVL
jgi:hypothetical protein